ncbi:hypothetical protein BGAL_0170g00180 [Botrytis galanthina]|uniref:Uncharacterized protein n=1 Tax=Botrytis galanthina TaxID=278940 RepID=A0A4S8QXD1_9HELO|nr:hypothetical protein BGAL_0170g00180 [Botrytis galanthina]
MSYYNGAYDDGNDEKHGEYQPARAGWKQSSPTGQDCKHQHQSRIKNTKRDYGIQIKRHHIREEFKREKSIIDYNYQMCPCRAHPGGGRMA